jgi:NADPH:quinone reductase-like Zn-dependent oxidoreductase
MKAAFYARHGEPAEVLTFGDVADLPPPGPSEVSVRVLKRMVHPLDHLLIRGVLPAPIPSGGAVPGHDGMGVVEEVGSDVDVASGIVPGARVNLFQVHGTWAERIVAPASAAIPIPDDVSDQAACQVVINGVTAVMLLRAAAAADDQACVSAPLLVTAAGSGVARNVIALARMRGLKVIAVVRRDVGAEILSRSFAGLKVVSTEHDGWQSAVLAAFGQAPVVALDPIGGEMTPQFLGLLAKRGTLLVYGGLDPRPSMISTIAMTARGLTIKGVDGFNWVTNTSPQQRAADIAEIFDMTRQVPQNFVDFREFALSDAVRVVSESETGPRRGATILVSNG